MPVWHKQEKKMTYELGAERRPSLFRGDARSLDGDQFSILGGLCARPRVDEPRARRRRAARIALPGLVVAVAAVVVLIHGIERETARPGQSIMHTATGLNAGTRLDDDWREDVQGAKTVATIVSALPEPGQVSGQTAAEGAGPTSAEGIPSAQPSGLAAVPPVARTPAQSMVGADRKQVRRDAGRKAGGASSAAGISAERRKAERDPDVDIITVIVENARPAQPRR